MFPDNPFLQLTLPRASSIFARISAAIWSEIAEVECQYAGSFPTAKLFKEAEQLDYTPVPLPFHWGKLFDQGWFKLAIPSVQSRGPVYLHWKDEGEGTVYVDGIPYYGFDVAHRHCQLPENTREVFIEGLCLQSAIWHPEATGLSRQGSQLSKASLCVRDNLAWEVYHDLKALYDLAVDEGKACNPCQPPKTTGFGYQPPVETVSVLYRRLLRGLDDTFNALDSGGLPAAQKLLKEIYARLKGQNEKISAILTGHAHIDLVWLWPEKSGTYKTVHTFSTMNRLMDLYPELVFGHSQPASYDAVEKTSPGLISQVKERIQSGRWEAVGATEVESDTLLPCGEALLRSFLVGQKGFQRLQGKPSRVLWLPDVFGYCGCLPQIMRQTGVEYFFTTKLTWSNISLFPYSSFIWRGIDGSEVVVHVTQENSYAQSASAEELRRGARAYRQSDIHDEFLSPTGFGDGGGGVTEEMCERARRYQSLAGMPEARWGKIEPFFDRLNEVREKLPTFQGELYLEFHRGVLTTHSDLKARFRECERAVQTWEAARSVTGAGEVDDQLWRRLIFSQFHDYIPGSSIWEVYEEGLPELAALSKEALSAAAREISKAKSPALFNPLPIGRTVIVGEDGEKKIVQLAPLSGCPVDELPEVSIRQSVEATPQGIRSGLASASFDSKGRITALVFEGKEIVTSGPLGELIIYPDQPSGFEAWDIDRQALSLGQAVDFEAEVSVTASNGVEGVVEFRRQLTPLSTALIRYRLDAFQPVLHIEYEIDWRDEQSLIKVLFPTRYRGRMARFGSPFGSVLRCQQAGDPRDEAMFESAGSRWAAVSDDGESQGLGVIAEAKYGFSCREGALSLSLLRSPNVTGEDWQHERMFPSSLRRGDPRPVYSDQGFHRIRLALCFHSLNQPRGNLAPALADTLFTPLLSYMGTAVQSRFLGLEGGETLVPCWAKPAEDGNGWILRLHETMGQRGKARIKLTEGGKAYPVDVLETIQPGNPVTEIDFEPYELRSLRVI